MTRSHGRPNNFSPTPRLNFNPHMKTIANIICSAFATVALAASSFGAIYETPKQFEPRKPDDVTRVDGSTVFLTWAWQDCRSRGRILQRQMLHGVVLV